MAESILSKLDLGFVIESDYSGTGCMEQAAAMMRQAVQLQSPSRRRGFEVHLVCDNDPRCCDIMQQRGSIASTVSPTFATRFISLSALQGVPRRWAAAAKRGALASESLLWRKRCGEAMVEEMCMIFEKATLLRKGFYCAHDRECVLYSGAESVIAVGENRCLDWPFMGKQGVFFFFFAKLFYKGSHDRGSVGLGLLASTSLQTDRQRSEIHRTREAHAIHTARQIPM